MTTRNDKTTRIKTTFVEPLTYNEIKGWESLEKGDIQRKHTIWATKWMLLAGLDLLKEKEMKDMPEWVNKIDISDVPNWLLKYWKKWDRDIKGLSPESKEKITSALARIKIKWNRDNEGHGIIIEIWGKTLDIHDRSFYNDIDSDYKDEIKNDRVKKTGVEWSERSFYNSGVYQIHNSRHYSRWEDAYHFPTEEENERILKKLWDFAGLDDESDQIAMLMVLTGMYWDYWIPNVYMGRPAGECITLICEENYRKIYKDYHGFGSYSVYSVGDNSDFLDDDDTVDDID